MSIASLVISAVEFVFTCIKSFLLARSCNRGKGRVAAIVFFVLESLCGIVLTVLLAIEAFNLSSYPGFIRTGAIVIVATELASVVTEAKLIATRWKEGTEHEPRHGYWRREILKWLVFLIATVQVAMSFYPWRDRVLFPSSDIRVHYAVPLALVLFCNIIIALQTFIMSEHLFARAVFSIVSLGLWITSAFIFVLFGNAGDFSRSFDFPSRYSFLAHTSTAVFAMAVGSAATAIAAWGLPNITTEGHISLAHVKVLETTSLGISGPTVVVGLSHDPRSSLQIMLTVLPQIGAIIIPIIFSYAKILFKASFGKQESDKDLAQSESYSFSKPGATLPADVA